MLSLIWVLIKRIRRSIKDQPRLSLRSTNNGIRMCSLRSMEKIEGIEWWENFHFLEKIASKNQQSRYARRKMKFKRILESFSQNSLKTLKIMGTLQRVGWFQANSQRKVSMPVNRKSKRRDPCTWSQQLVFNHSTITYWSTIRLSRTGNPQNRDIATIISTKNIRTPFITLWRTNRILS